MKPVRYLTLGMLWASLAVTQTLAWGQGNERPRIIGNDRSFVVNTPNGPLTITRSGTEFGVNKGVLQPLIPAPGVTPVTEIEVLHALNDPGTMVIDMRDEEEPLAYAIPNTFHIEFNEIEDRMDEIGCSRETKRAKWDCSRAPKIIAFCNGPMCLQSPIGIRTLIREGFPVEKISYYRGGIMDWRALGLTTVQGNRNTWKAK